LSAPDNLEGKSLKPVLEDRSVAVKPAAFTQHPRPAYPPGRDNPDVMGYSMRTDRFRYTEWRKYQGGQIVARELYDHRKDPQEDDNLADDPAVTETVRQLAECLSETIAP
jgi:iduronate 2-sulfatase